MPAGANCGRWPEAAGRDRPVTTVRRALAVTLAGVALATAGCPPAHGAVDAARPPATTDAVPAGAPPVDPTAAPGGDDAAPAPGGGDGRAVALWIGGEVMLLLAGTAAVRWRSRRRSRRRIEHASGPAVELCPACGTGRPCLRPPHAATCERPPVRIRL